MSPSLILQRFIQRMFWFSLFPQLLTQLTVSFRLISIWAGKNMRDRRWNIVTNSEILEHSTNHLCMGFCKSQGYADSWVLRCFDCGMALEVRRWEEQLERNHEWWRALPWETWASSCVGSVACDFCHLAEQVLLYKLETVCTLSKRGTPWDSHIYGCMNL